MSDRTPFRLIIAGAVLLAGFGATLSAHAQAGSSLPDPANLPCSAFQRGANGGWTVVSPATLDFGQVKMQVNPGDTFGPGTMTKGVAIPVMLDRQCGNQ